MASIKIYLENVLLSNLILKAGHLKKTILQRRTLSQNIFGGYRRFGNNI